MDLGIRGKTAFLFGAGRGIGAATARTLAEEGAKQVLFARTEESLRQTADAISADGGAVDWTAVDLTDGAATDKAIAAAIARHGVPDLMLYSAGTAQGGLLWELADEVWDEAFDLKFMGMIRCLRAVCGPMKERGSGRIVVIVGNNGRQPSARNLPGSAANAACLAVIRGVAEQLAPHGVTINALNPGPTRTHRWTGLISGLAKQSRRDEADIEAELVAPIPKKRACTPEEIGRLAVMLMSEHAEMATGVSLTADGGATRAIA